MKPFLLFRVWLRRGPTAERVLAGVATAIVLALLAWAAIPVDAGGTDVAAGPSGGEQAAAAASRGGGASGQAGAGGAATSAGGSATAAGGGNVSAASAGNATATNGSPSSASGGGAATAQAAGASTCDGLRANDQGVTDKDLSIAVTRINLGGAIGNETFGIRSDLDNVINAVVAAVNANGGVACRKLKVKIYPVNPVDTNDQRSKCLQVVGDKPFMVMDIAANVTPASRACYVQNKLPFTGESPLAEKETAQGRPYLFGIRASMDRQLRNFVLGAAERGVFRDPSFKKLGILIDSCAPEVIDQVKSELHQVGVDSDRISMFVSSCEASASTSQLSQAVAQHRRDGVSHVFLALSIVSAQAYVRQADGLRWQPHYLVSDYGGGTGTAGAEEQWPDGFADAIGITSTRQGELNSHVMTPLRQECQGWVRKGGVKVSSDDGDAQWWVCDLFRLLTAVGNRAGPNLVRTSLVDAVPKVGKFETTHYGDAVFDRPGKLWGGDFIRSNQWHLDCHCWRIRDPQLGPGH